jgi:hypothetical protein
VSARASVYLKWSLQDIRRAADTCCRGDGVSAHPHHPRVKQEMGEFCEDQQLEPENPALWLLQFKPLAIHLSVYTQAGMSTFLRREE